MSKEAMKLALEALEWCHGGEPCGTAEAITALREALAEQKSGIKQVIELYDSPDQPSQQEPVAYMGTDSDGNPNKFRLNPFSGCVSLYEKPSPVQKPVAYMDICEKNQMSGLRYWSEPDNRHEVPLYTSPPAQRTWVGLTDEEITDIWAGTSPYYHEDDFAKAIEAKLRERNT